MEAPPASAICRCWAFSSSLIPFQCPSKGTPQRAQHLRPQEYVNDPRGASESTHALRILKS